MSRFGTEFSSGVYFNFDWIFSFNVFLKFEFYSDFVIFSWIHVIDKDQKVNFNLKSK